MNELEYSKGDITMTTGVGGGHGLRVGDRIKIGWYADFYVTRVTDVLGNSLGLLDPAVYRAEQAFEALFEWSCYVAGLLFALVWVLS